LINTNSCSGEKLTSEFSDMSILWSAADRLKSVQIDNRPAMEVIRRYDTSETLFYIDPPYVTSTRYGNRKSYDHEMDDNEHAALIDTLKRAQGYVVLSGYECEMYDRLLVGWAKHVTASRSNGQSNERECVWLSPRTAKHAVLPLPLFS
jgi:DNA adenine methylase